MYESGIIIREVRIIDGKKESFYKPKINVSQEVIDERDRTKNAVKGIFRKLHKKNKEMMIIESRLMIIKKLIKRNKNMSQLQIKMLDFSKNTIDLKSTIPNKRISNFNTAADDRPSSSNKTSKNSSLTVPRISKPDDSPQIPPLLETNSSGQISKLPSTPVPSKETTNFVEVNDRKFWESNSMCSKDQRRVYIPFYLYVPKSQDVKFEKPEQDKGSISIKSKNEVFVFEDFEVISRLI
jgi:hypothetical protein